MTTPDNATPPKDPPPQEINWVLASNTVRAFLTMMVAPILTRILPVDVDVELAIDIIAAIVVGGWGIVQRMKAKGPLTIKKPAP